jgi:hypothetical protein
MNLIQLAEIVKSAEPMDELDYESFPGAPEGSLIAYSEIAVYIVSENEISVVTEDSETRYELTKLFEVEV